METSPVSIIEFRRFDRRIYVVMFFIIKIDVCTNKITDSHLAKRNILIQKFSFVDLSYLASFCPIVFRCKISDSRDCLRNLKAMSLQHAVSELHWRYIYIYIYINIAKSCRTRKSSEEGWGTKRRVREHAWLVSTFQNCNARRVHCHLFPPPSTSAKGTYLFSSRENRGRPSQPRLRRWKIEYLVPVERTETSWNWSNIQSLLARESASLIPAEKDVPSLAKNYWQYADKVRFPELLRYCVPFTSTSSSWYEISRQKVPRGFYSSYSSHFFFFSSFIIKENIICGEIRWIQFCSKLSRDEIFEDILKRYYVIKQKYEPIKI